MVLLSSARLRLGALVVVAGVAFACLEHGRWCSSAGGVFVVVVVVVVWCT